MIIYPAIDLRGGRVVRLTEGKFDQEKSYGTDPLAVALDFKAAGATWLHVVDLDGAKDPNQRQTALVETLARGSGLRVQTGGGIRDEAQISTLMAAGAERVIVGSLAVKNPVPIASRCRPTSASTPPARPASPPRVGRKPPASPSTISSPISSLSV